MSYDYSKLIGRIKEKCGSQAIFAQKMNISERTVSLKLNNIRDWRQEEIDRACGNDVLDICVSDIPSYFFKQSVQNWTIN